MTIANEMSDQAGMPRQKSFCNKSIKRDGVIATTENMPGGAALHPGDVLEAMNGKTIEVNNTDAEGRLILADALAAADEEAPDYLIDLATLTGAARTALGPELPPVYCDDDGFCEKLREAASREADPLWRMPLWTNYAKGLESRIADLKSTGDGAFAGSIYGALFLKRFVSKAKIWVHSDIYAWNPETRPGRPHGGEAQTIRAFYSALGAGLS